MRGVFNSGCMILGSELQRSNKTHRALRTRALGKAPEGREPLAEVH